MTEGLSRCIKEVDDLQDDDFRYFYIKRLNPDFFESFSKLNSYQKEAVVNEDRVLLLNAGVGCGKTTVLVHKVLYLYHIKKVPLSEMVVLTFTNKAADEIKERVISSGNGSIDIREMKYFGTFHSVARSLLQEVLPVEELGYNRDFSILDENGAQELLMSIIESRGLDIKYKNRMEKRLDELKLGRKLYGAMKHEDELEELIRIYHDEKLKRNMMDFDDLIQCCSRLLPHVDFKPSWVIIDEFQDTDSRQLEMADGLIGMDTCVFAVGDPNQIIYSWRGSRHDIFKTFKEKYCAAEKTLPVNYRSTATILEAARAFLNDTSSLEGIREKGAAITIKRHFNSFNEALYLVEKIRKLHFEECISYSEIGIFYRKQKHSRVFEDVFKHENIPYEVSLRKDFKDIPVLYWFIRLMRASMNSKDYDSWLYVLCDNKYGIGLTSKQAQKCIEEGHDSSCRLVIKMLDFRDWCNGITYDEDLCGKIYDYFDLDSYLSPTSVTFNEDREYILKFIKELVGYADKNKLSPKDGIKKAVDYAMLYGRQFMEHIADTEKDSVKLMTLHASKGLEFKYVFISGANYGVIPVGGKVDDEEEKRLFFVGITRAKDYLEISYHSNPDDYGALPSPSPYIRMIPDELIVSDDIKSRDQKLSELRREIKSRMEMKKDEPCAKRRVSHPKYGEGYVISENDDVITAEFEGYGEKSFVKAFCPLKFL